MELYEIRHLLDENRDQLESFRGSLDLESLKETIAENEEKMLDPSFWDDSDKAQALIQSNNQAKSIYQTFHDLETELEELETFYELVSEVPDDPDLGAEMQDKLQIFNQELAKYERNMLLSGEYDKFSAILEIHPGAGGTESQDWASMLTRMYERWASQHGYKINYLDYQAGDEAGIKTVSMEILGHNAYGLLKSEHGIHRLVRISPFDSNSRRHTSFASVEVMPEIDQQTEIEINPDDIEMDVFRASGAGGQHVNKTSSAVRLRHLPTGIVVASQDQRSQIQNREVAMRMLQAKLARILEEENAKELDEIRGEKSQIAWGSQIRSYVFHPYNMVKDHRTNCETADVDGVMDGAIDSFIDAYLKAQLDNEVTG
ncbi:peptide chain release factor 2 [Aerococcus sanguinicola]|uniref:Peptide chain release factor 2 n=1 Tax=Aerococcus sanguinicola TaxID=119206 RepID=A0A5N1GMR6_9LACT|nr:peptide chain release factor 2 [Aerococcus sanguinicola]KAA9302283.1 peptide chain release factor 2 [Aerococcus sanguinicola]